MPSEITPSSGRSPAVSSSPSGGSAPGRLGPGETITNLACLATIGVIAACHQEVNPLWLLGAVVTIGAPTHAGWMLAPVRRMIAGGR